MQFVTVPLELTKEAMKEVAKETVKTTAEGLTDFGKVGKEAATEHISLGRVGVGDCGRQISFGSLANGAFKSNKNYLKWKDGIDVGELRQGWIEELTNEISEIFGYDNIKASKKYFDFNKYGLYRFNNAGIVYNIGELVYDPKYLRENGNKYGMDSIIGTLAHEVGHRVVYNIGLSDKIDPYENEACADYIAGLTTRLCKLNGAQKLAWYNDRSVISTDKVHPGKSVRMEAFIRGFARIDTGPEAVKLRIFEDFSPYDLEKVYQNSELLRNMLYEDVINPLRNGEIIHV